MLSDSPARPACFSFCPHRSALKFKSKYQSTQVTVRNLAPSASVFCFVLMSIAGVTLPPSRTALADEVAPRTASSNQAVVSEADDAASSVDLKRITSPAVAGSASSAVIRLPASAGARGWIGPNAHYYVAPVTRKSHSAYDGPPIPPPAPPTDLPPLSESPVSDDSATEAADSATGRKMRTLTSTLRAQTVQHRKSTTPGMHTVQLLRNAQQTDASQPTFQLESPVKVSRQPPVTRLVAQEAVSSDAPLDTDSSGSRTGTTRTDDDSELNLKQSGREASTGPAVSRVQSLSRPLNQVSLADAQRLKTLSGDDLRVPEDRAAQLFADVPEQYELPRGFGVPRPARNARQLIHNPLYFEDPNMERCGIGYGCLTEVASAVRFFGRVPVMPYLMASRPPNSCVRTLGDCPACHAFGVDAYLPPLDPHASAVQAAFTVGLIFLIP